MTRSSPTLVSYEKVPAAPLVQKLVVMSCPGSTGLAKRTASSLRRSVRESASSVSAAHEVNAMVHNPCAMMPGNPAATAASLSRWIGMGSPAAGPYRKVWSSSTC
ncbi:Uncharacterised protein [Mycobacteroides abscessus subsp. abscessus]|nr:Uncharacterised protein [Mycobacteroides abscessus subsp. abscessus]SKV87371.1 Uncharacterised protein [Mycobacteroides abscessus subsp. abscessus]